MDSTRPLVGTCGSRGGLAGVVAATAFIASTYLLETSSVWLTFRNVPPGWLLAIAAIGVATCATRSMWLPMAFAAAGLLTLTHSLAPGHTVVNFLWEVIYVAAAAMMVPRSARLALFAILTWRGFTHLSVSAIVLQSVSPNLASYAYGGIAAALLFPVLAWGSEALVDRGRRTGMRLMVTALALVLSAMALFVSLGSGSRALWLAVVLALIVYLIQARLKGLFIASLLVLIGASVGALAYDAALPTSVLRPLAAERLTLEHQADDLASPIGNARWRVAMWHQALGALSAHPFGTGAGSFSSVIHAFQLYPMLWSTSAHNFLVETLMTGGILRFVLIITIIGIALKRSWSDQREWGWVAAIVAIWLPLLFDVTGSNPVYMMTAWAATAAGGRVPLQSRLTTTRVLPVFVILVVAGWWFWPCPGTMCSITRHLGFTPSVESALRSATPSEAREVVAGARRLYPRTLEWQVHSLTLDELGAAHLGDVVRSYPYASIRLYSGAVDALAALRACERAGEVAAVGLHNLGTYNDLFGQARISRSDHEAVVEHLQAFLVESGSCEDVTGLQY